MAIENSEIEFSIFWELSNDLHALLDTNFHFVKVNGNIISLLNYKASELEGKCIFDFIYSDDLEQAQKHFKAALKADEKVKVVTLFRGGRDAYVWLEWNVFYHKVHQHLYVSATNITETIKVERRLKRFQKRIEEMQSIAKLGTWEMDVKTKSMKWSDSMFEIFKIDRKEGTPSFKGFLSSVVEEDRINLIEEVNKSLHDGTPYELEIRYIDGDGQILYIIARGAPIEEQLKIKKIYGTILDITKQKRIEKELLLSKLEAEKLARIKQQFLANMSHEIRTPLNAMIGFTDVLIESDLNKEQKKQLGAVKHSGDQLLGVINDILDFTKIEQGLIELESIPFDITSTFSEIYEQYAVLAAQKKLQYLIEIDEAVPETVFGDALRLKQILGNLISNAFKFTSRGKVVLSMTLEQDSDEEVLLCIKVRDSGIGIPAAKMQTIFESFAQAASDTSRKYGGTGLGLTIVRHLIELHGGTIEVRSKMLKGSVFEVKIPYRKVTENNLEPEKFSGQIDETSIDISSTNILLVEDNKMNQMLAKTILAKWGAVTDIADDGLAGLAMVKEKNYDCILMDLAMPKMDGYTCLSCIRELGDDKANLPIMAMTAHAFASELEKCKELGFNDYISKPFNKSDFKQKIYNLIHHGGSFSSDVTESSSSKEVRKFIDALCEEETTKWIQYSSSFAMTTRELYTSMLYDKTTDLVKVASEVMEKYSFDRSGTIVNLLEVVKKFGASNKHHNEVKIAIDQLLLYSNAISNLQE